MLFNSQARFCWSKNQFLLHFIVWPFLLDTAQFHFWHLVKISCSSAYYHIFNSQFHPRRPYLLNHFIFLHEIHDTNQIHENNVCYELEMVSFTCCRSHCILLPNKPAEDCRRNVEYIIQCSHQKPFLVLKFIFLM